MRRLNLSRKPAWLTIDPDPEAELRMLVLPLRRVDLLRMIGPMADMLINANPTTKGEAVRGALSLCEMAVTLALELVQEWTVVDTDTGERLPVTREVAEALFDDLGLAARFVEAVTAGMAREAEALESEKNDSAPSPNGFTAAADDTANPATAPVPSVPRG